MADAYLHFREADIACASNVLLLPPKAFSFDDMNAEGDLTRNTSDFVSRNRFYLS